MQNASTLRDTQCEQECDDSSMKTLAASVLLSATVMCGAHAVADEAAAPPAPVDAHATHRTLMKECLDKERSQNGGTALEDARKLCAMRVKTQMQQLKDAGAAMPPASAPQSPVANPQ
jgi:hypothetical protein